MRTWVFIKYDFVLLSKTLPIKKGNKLVELRAEVVKGLVMTYGSGLRAAPDFTAFVNELLLDVVKKEQFLSRYKPFSHLKYSGYHADSIFVKDKQRKLVAEIILKDGLVFCDSPDSASDCEHVRFVTSLIDVANNLHDK